MKQWIQLPHIEGVCSRQAHADFPQGEDGKPVYERELGKEGFFGPSSHMIQKHAPTAWTDWNGPLKPRAFDLTKLKDTTALPWESSPILSNNFTEIRWWNLSKAMDKLARNADGDQLLFIHAGSADLFCDYGHLKITEGDYIMLPRGTMWRLDPLNSLKILMIEATDSSYQLPDKGLVGPHAIFDPGMLDIPTINECFKTQQQEKDHEWQVVVKRRKALTSITYPFNPLDTLGWHGNLMPVRINWRDIRPLMSHRFHLPPSAHTTFVANRFVVCTFCPRPIETDPGALKVPFYHNNEDYDEFIFYHQGQFFSRDNIHPGMTTLHPCGFTHGPHPGAFAIGAKAERRETDEVAVMIDTRDPLNVPDLPENVEWKEYIHSWKGITNP